MVSHISIYSIFRVQIFADDFNEVYVFICVCLMAIFAVYLFQKMLQVILTYMSECLTIVCFIFYFLLLISFLLVCLTMGCPWILFVSWYLYLFIANIYLGKSRRFLMDSNELQSFKLNGFWMQAKEKLLFIMEKRRKKNLFLIHYII